MGRMFQKMKELMVSKAKALVGRTTRMQISDKHFVLGSQMEPPFPAGFEVCVFGTGCFWGSEKGYWRLPGVFTTAVGYAGGFTPNPTYQEVCTGQTGHNEVVQVVFDPNRISFADILRQFWESHDPTQGMGQGGDRGTQYRSGIYPTTSEQRELAYLSRDAYQQALAAAGKGAITTEISDEPVTFYYAEDYHQQYLAKPGNRQYCSAEPLGISVPPFVPANLQDHAPKLSAAFWAKHAPKPGCVIKGPNAQIQWNE
eukprot:c203_g1_i1.p1 GENE.c203_g1_i1~~c203_g1_i1.p1  ORF type:complete len:256 (-),score=32.53 c203_g1_i1:21-788(-)